MIVPVIFCLALLVIIALGTWWLYASPALRMSRSVVYWTLIMCVAGLFPATTPIAIGERFSVDSLLHDGDLETGNLGTAGVLLVGSTVLTLAVCAYVFYGIVRFRLTRLSRTQAQLLAAFACYAGLSSICDIVTGSAFLARYRFLGIFIALAALLLADVPKAQFLYVTRRILGIYAYSSLILIPLAPGIVMTDNYTAGILAGVTIRLAGLANHFALLAHMMGIFIFIEIVHCKERSRVTRASVANIAVALVAMFLAQSKTIMAAFPMTIVMMYMIGRARSRNAIVAILLTLLLVVALVAVSGVLDVNQLGGREASVDTLSGRVPVWNYILAKWTDQPIIGAGASLFSEASRHEIFAVAGWAPIHAHSQFFQVLGEYGLVGMSGFLIYFGTLFFQCVRLARATFGASIAIFAFICIHGLTEEAFSFQRGTNDLFVQLVLFSLLVVYSKTQVKTPGQGKRQGTKALKKPEQSPMQTVRQSRG